VQVGASFRLALGKAEHGFNLAHTGHTGHLTLWAEPVKLRDATVDIEMVAESS
jgi:hypothetical protein